MTKTYELPNEKMIIADVDEKRHMATVSVYALNDLVKEVNKTGHWIEDEDEMKVWCSECGEDNDDCSDYCPNCGARMTESEVNT